MFYCCNNLKFVSFNNSDFRPMTQRLEVLRNCPLKPDLARAR